MVENVLCCKCSKCVLLLSIDEINSNISESREQDKTKNNNNNNE